MGLLSSTGERAAYTRINANTTQNIYKKGGTVTGTQKQFVSSNGKTDTITNTSTNAEGKCRERREGLR